jgi:hypothetical protein
MPVKKINSGDEMIMGELQIDIFSLNAIFTIYFFPRISSNFFELEVSQ